VEVSRKLRRISRKLRRINSNLMLTSHPPKPPTNISASFSLKDSKPAEVNPFSKQTNVKMKTFFFATIFFYEISLTLHIL
jgi:hypothetical protein